MKDDSGWFYFSPYLSRERWNTECEGVEERFSLFSSFVEMPFLGFRGIVSRGGVAYRVTVAAEMDFYPKHVPWVFTDPSVAGAGADGKVTITEKWDPETSSFASLIATVVARIESAHGSPSEAA